MFCNEEDVNDGQKLVLVLIPRDLVLTENDDYDVAARRGREGGKLFWFQKI